jgi:hypothetical protein
MKIISDYAAIKRTEENYISEHPELWCIRTQAMLKALEKTNQPK